MPLLKKFVAGVHALISRHRVDRDLDDELRDYLANAEDAYQRTGLSPTDAARAARVEMGSLTAAKDEVRTGFWEASVEAVLRDLKYGVRQLMRQPGFTLIAMLTMALGIGVNVTVFSALNAVALRPLPIRHADRAVRIERWFASRSRGNGQYFFSYPEYLRLRDNTQAFDSLVAVSMSVRVPLAAGPDAPGDSWSERQLQGQLVSDNFFLGLGVDAALGRTFTVEEARVPGGQPVIVLSDGFWRRRLNGDRQRVGTPLVLGGTPFTVVGVMPPAFVGAANPPQTPDFWAPLAMQPYLARGSDWMTDQNARSLQLVGILAAGTSVATGGMRVAALTASWNQTFPAEDKTTALTIEHATFFGETNDPRFLLFVTVLLLVVGLILLTASANLANMLLARASTRGHEIGVRLALGASRGRIVRQLLTESLLLSLGGGVFALAGSMAAAKLLWVRVEETVQLVAGSSGHFAVDLSPDVRVFAYTFAVAVAAAVASGLWPALQASRADINSTTKDRSAQSTDSDRSRLRGLLIGAQVAISMTLLITAGLLTRGVMRSTSVNPGIDATHIYFVSTPGGPDVTRGPLWQLALVRKLRDTPEIAAAGLADRVPFRGHWSPPVQIDDSTAGPGRVPTSTLANVVSSGFFETLGIPILRGRDFSADETTTGARVAVISDSGARAFWPGADPIGRQIKLDLKFTGRYQGFTVIGVVGDVRSANLSRLDPSFVYLATNGTDRYNVIVRSNRDLPTLKTAIAREFGARSPDAAQLESFDTFLQIQRILPETLASFSTLLSVMALLLAATGIHSVVSFLASQRVREIGIRMAFGASSRDAVLLVLRRALRPVAVGMAVGLVLAMAISGSLSATLASPAAPDLLFGIGAFDPLTFGGLAILMAAIALVASAAPALRASAVDPVRALRIE